VNVADYCNPSFAVTLTHVSSLEHVCECVLLLAAHSL
jgi:hypothetical protein